MSMAFLSVHALDSVFSKQAEADMLLSSLKKVSNPKDSVSILYDIYDLSSQGRKREVAWKLLDVALRNKYHDVAFDIIPHIAVLDAQKKNMLDSLIAITSRLPDGSQRKGVDLFVQVEKAAHEAAYMSIEDRQQALMGYVREDITPKYDLYQDILDLYRVVIFVRYTAKGSMYLEYFSRLEDMINELPEENRFLQNLFYTTAANFYSNNDLPEKAIAADRKLLDIIEKLEVYYDKVGRKYRSFDRNYYICYRRMLRNYKNLTPDQVKEYYMKCAMIAEKDEECNHSFYLDRRPTAYRLMAEKDYAGAIPYLKQALDNVKEKHVRQSLLCMLVEASDAVNDNATLLASLKEYNTILSEKVQQKAEEAVIEYQMRYDVSKLKAEKSELQLQKKDLEIGMNQKVISISLIALLLLVVALMALYRSHFKLLREKRDLEDKNEKLRKNIEEMLDDGNPYGSEDLHSMSSRQKVDQL